MDPDGHCGLIGDAPCSAGQFVASLPDRVIGGLKGEANVILNMTRLGELVTFRFQPSNEEQAEVMGNVDDAAPVLETGLAMAIPGPKKLPTGRAGPSGQLEGKLDKSPTGRGIVPPSQRDPKRTLTPKEKADKLAEQGGTCANCDKPLAAGDGVAHHYPDRHADGARTTPKTIKIVCADCHKELHSGSNEED